MIDFQQRLSKAMSDASMKTADLARAIGVSYQAIKRLEEGKAKSFSSANNSKAADALGVSARWLATGEGPMRTTSEDLSEIGLENNPEFPAIKRVRFRLSAGASGFGVEYVGDQGSPIVFRREWFESRGLRPSKLFATRVINGSMEPGLYDGDTVIVNTESTDPKDGVVFAVNYEGELVIKRLVRDAGQWWLSSDNPDQRRHPRKTCHEGVVLIGEIVHKQSERI